MILQIYPGPGSSPVQSITLWLLISSESIFQDPLHSGEGIMIYPYLDYCLLRIISFDEPLQITQTTVELFRDLGLTDQCPKIDVSPGTVLRIYRSQSQLITDEDAPSTAQVHNLSTLIDSVQTSAQISARHCLQLLGHLAAGRSLITHARLHMRCLQVWFCSVYRLNRDRLDKPLSLSSKVKHSLD